jgi:hypothetical protein
MQARPYPPIYYSFNMWLTQTAFRVRKQHRNKECLPSTIHFYIVMSYFNRFLSSTPTSPECSLTLYRLQYASFTILTWRGYRKRTVRKIWFILKGVNEVLNETRISAFMQIHYGVQHSNVLGSTCELPPFAFKNPPSLPFTYHDQNNAISIIFGTNILLYLTTSIPLTWFTTARTGGMISELHRMWKEAVVAQCRSVEASTWTHTFLFMILRVSNWRWPSVRGRNML